MIKSHIRLLPLLACLFFMTNFSVKAQGDFFDHTETFLNTYVSAQGVNYSGLQKNMKVLDDIVYQIGHTALNGRSVEYKAAFYINAYNILVINQVVRNMPLESPLDVDGFFDKNKFMISGESLTLNEIENEKLRRDFHDNRIHFALVCGARGCPPLSSTAFTPSNLRDQLDIRTRGALNNPKFIRINQSDKQVNVSQIFEWYLVDFGGEKTGLIPYINKYRESKIPADYKVGYYSYDWDLNGY